MIGGLIRLFLKSSYQQENNDKTILQNRPNCKKYFIL